MSATERVLFALGAKRALAPSSKPAAAEWITHDVHVDALPATDDDACYRVMDWLQEVKDDLEKQVFDEGANLLNLEVGLLFFDPTSTYFELEEPDEPVARGDTGRRWTTARTTARRTRPGFAPTAGPRAVATPCRRS